MFFFKKKQDLSSFITLSANEVLKVPPYTYDDYLAIDSDCILSQEEFEEFIGNLSLLRLLLLYAMLVDRKDRGQIKASVKELGQTFIQALVTAYLENGIDHDGALRLSEVFSLELDHLASYMVSIPEKDLSEKGYTPHTCLYFTAKFVEPAESVKNGVYIALINTQRKLMKGYFENAIDKVKIIN